MEVLIREIEERDYRDVLEIWNSEIGSSFTNESFRSHHDKFKGNDNYKAFVAELENKIVGFVYIMQCTPWTVEGDYFWIQGIAVKSDMHGKGIGTKLLEHIENYGKEKGVICITLNTGFKRTDAHAFYERNGYTSGNYCYGKNI